MSKKEYKVKTKRTLGFRIFKGFLKIFVRKSKVVNLTDRPFEQRAIYLMNHCAARGPLVFELRFPLLSSPWGAHEMCGNYKERWNYLYRVFYTQKLHWNKVRAFIVATVFATFSKWLYNSIGLIGTYHDARFMISLRNSINVLNSDVAVVIFPEDSTEGYFDRATSFNNGFIHLSKAYFKREKQDLPVYSVYYNKKKNTFYVSEPQKINEMLASGMSEDEVSAVFLEKNHKLYDAYSGKK